MAWVHINGAALATLKGGRPDWGDPPPWAQVWLQDCPTPDPAAPASSTPDVPDGWYRVAAGPGWLWLAHLDMLRACVAAGAPPPHNREPCVVCVEAAQLRSNPAAQLFVSYATHVLGLWVLTSVRGTCTWLQVRAQRPSKPCSHNMHRVEAP